MVTESEMASRIFRRSLFAVKDVKKGEVFTQENIRSIRPGHGLAPNYLNEVIGKRAKRAIRRGSPLAWELIE
jgi:sialic acid synthase SpsE